MMAEWSIIIIINALFFYVDHVAFNGDFQRVIKWSKVLIPVAWSLMV